ncbi:hypothetical protein LTR91_009855 [Friedmanniomyces endolithicus]|uniref:Uncharacterized protein n=1 Tax=Friedmanniomyces endolithicus TaxID=329885 RepID=A0AAN6KKB7_9PEZI|nr:hypothetical protein LTR75_012084 [Friedmanniomyces endolithicus]KAK0836512.1 hypothetical protein LTR03_013613 [Friedmanniomyces endolithicus]KAK0852372.1 hypothetical protein LTS02_012397 [Friedmanniomyces endolithicus]KAK0872113.1 hypothetical protein LTR87_012577 [Friedmanniomyces endolithicus]KAK0895942.1 hypothetical protein LTR02_011507 [Friedmanniomyces endolithicus]
MATSTLPSTPTTTGMPTPNDGGLGGSPSSDPGSSPGPGDHSLVNYYFVFLAIIIAVAALTSFLLYKRRRAAILAGSLNRQTALSRDLTTWHGGDGGDGYAGRSSRGYWHSGQVRSHEDAGPEEGLNELGEAPPAYVAPPPKEARCEDGDTAGHERFGGDGPAVPLQTLSREDAGLKPPDYVERSAGVDNDGGERVRWRGELDAGGAEAGGVFIVIAVLSREHY